MGKVAGYIQLGLEVQAVTSVVRSHRASPGSTTNLLCDLWPITTHFGPQLLYLKIRRLDQTSDFQMTFEAPGSSRSISREALQGKGEDVGMELRPLDYVFSVHPFL